MSWLPAMSRSWPSIAAFMPEPHTLLIVVAPVDVGRPALIARLARRGLALAGRQHAAHDDFLDLFGLHAGALDRGADGDRAEVGGRRGRKDRPSWRRSACARPKR